jgi:3',5'-cyclic-AMP phosphodiesterase
MKTTRRQLLTMGAAAALSTVPEISKAEEWRWRRKRVLRIAHITDIHVQPEKQAALGMETCLERAQACKPDMLFLGGDMVMDCLSADKDRVRAQWDLFDRVLKANTSVKVESCLGNHDIWGWAEIVKYKSEAGFGKVYALDRLELDRPYRSFNRAGWHFIILDSTHRKRGNGYIGKLDEQQFEWLKDDLAKVPKERPILVMSHIPILSACAFFDGPNEKSGEWCVPAAWMHIDARRIKDLFRKYANIKACVSGHIHLVDRVKYNGIPYYCNGAASGAWWDGPYQETRNGFALIDLYEDGMVENRYVDYAWNPKP